MNRRGFLTGLISGLITAPAIVRASSLMQISKLPATDWHPVINYDIMLDDIPANGMLTINMITREAIRLWKHSNAFLQTINKDYESTLKGKARVGDILSIKLPKNFSVKS